MNQDCGGEAPGTTMTITPKASAVRNLCCPNQSLDAGRDLPQFPRADLGDVFQTAS